MNSDDAMKVIGAGISFKGRVCIAISGLICLFFPGFVFITFSKSVVEAYEKLPIRDRRTVLSILDGFND
jgi:hypothetical protein